MSYYETVWTATGQPYRVPVSEIRTYLEQGYRRENPVPPLKVSPEVEKLVSGPDSDPDTNPATDLATHLLNKPANPVGEGVVRINHDSIANLSKGLPGLGTAAIRMVKEQRPYGCIEDLIAKVPLNDGQSWMSFESIISFS
ncbi:MAG TPA: hypothetical protein V6C57_22715 [Coleofasciculaceae cyanobacterium]